jgi:uncharacterized Ntn-hydrolase superfamily protein
VTFSLIGRCARTGRLGLGITTFSLAMGGHCEGVAANIGICETQAFPDRGNDPLAVELLARGFTPARVISMLEANDPDHAWRQIAIMDREGTIAAHTGEHTRGWSGHATGNACVAFGNGLVGPAVLEGLTPASSPRPGRRWNGG